MCATDVKALGLWEAIGRGVRSHRGVGVDKKGHDEVLDVAGGLALGERKSVEDAERSSQRLGREG